VSPLHTKEDHGERLQVHAKTQEKVSPLLGDPVILTDRGPWYHDSVIRGSRASRTTSTRPSSWVARLAERFRATSRRGRGRSTTTPIPRRRCSHHSWTSWKFSLRGTRSGGDTDECLSGQDQPKLTSIISHYSAIIFLDVFFHPLEYLLLLIFQNC